jgi:hypothetical protein
MNISLTFSDLAKLAVNGKVEKDGNTLSVSWPILSDVSVSADGTQGFVRFSMDESLPPQEAKLPGGIIYINRSNQRTKRD